MQDRCKSKCKQDAGKCNNKRSNVQAKKVQRVQTMQQKCKSGKQTTTTMNIVQSQRKQNNSPKQHNTTQYTTKQTLTQQHITNSISQNSRTEKIIQNNTTRSKRRLRARRTQE